MEFNHLQSAALSDIGRKRKANEDAILVLPDAGVFCVADGMGGAAGGELASRWTVEAIQRAFPTGVESSQKTAQVRQALNEASQRIKAMADEQAIVGAGTTAVVLFFDDYQPDQATILHAGDSRAYRFREGLMECITQDHSLAASAGLDYDAALPSMFRGVITRAIGLDNTVELDESVIQVKEGDCYLLCSDGLTKMLNDGDIQNLVHKTSTADPDRLAAVLVEEANRAGGDDNISVVLVRVGKLPGRKDRPNAPDNVSVVDITETAEVVVPAGGAAAADRPAAPAATGGTSESGRTTETEDIFVGVTPLSGHGSTINVPPGGIPAGAPGRQPLSARQPPAAASTASRSAGRLLFMVLLIIALAAAYYLNRHYQHRVAPPPAPAELRPEATAAPAPAPVSASAGGFMDRVAGTEKAAAWQEEWNKALRDAAYPAATLEPYRQVIATLCATLKLPPPAAAAQAPGAQTAEQRAEAYCLQLFNLQQHLRTQAGVFVDDRAAELALFGDSPAAVLDTLRRFAGQPAQPATDPGQPFATLRHDLQLVAKWLAEDPRRLIPLEEIRGGPPSLLPRILAQRDELWAGVLADIAACGPAIEQRQQKEAEDSLLNNIAALHLAITKNVQASRLRSDVISWPGKGNLPTLDGFFKRVGQYMERAPAAPAGTGEPDSREDEGLRQSQSPTAS